MKAVNLFEATQVLQRAKRDVLGAEHEIDKNALELYGVEPNLDTMLLEHDNPKKEIFPSKENQKHVNPKIRGDTSITELERLAGL